METSMNRRKFFTALLGAPAAVALAATAPAASAVLHAGEAGAELVTPPAYGPPMAGLKFMPNGEVVRWRRDEREMEAVTEHVMRKIASGRRNRIRA